MQMGSGEGRVFQGKAFRSKGSSRFHSCVDGGVQTTDLPASADFDDNHGKRNDQDRSCHHSQRNPGKSVVMTHRVAGITSASSRSARQKKSKVGEMVRLTAKKRILSRVGQTLVNAPPLGLALVEIAQTGRVCFVDLRVIGQLKADDQGSVQLGDGLSLRVCQSDIQNGSSQVLTEEVLRHIGGESNG